MDYSASRLDAYDYKFIDENDQIRQDLQAVHNLNAGAEVRLGTLYLRAGAKYLIISNPTHGSQEYLAPFIQDKIGQFQNVSIYRLSD